MRQVLEKINQFINDQRKVLKLFALGALLFFIGIGFIQWADKLMAPSLRQELYVLLGLGIGGLGFSISLLAQLFLIIYRFKHMGDKE